MNKGRLFCQNYLVSDHYVEELTNNTCSGVAITPAGRRVLDKTSIPFHLENCNTHKPMEVVSHQPVSFTQPEYIPSGARALAMPREEIAVDHNENDVRQLAARSSNANLLHVDLNNIASFDGTLFLHTTYENAPFSEICELHQTGTSIRQGQVIDVITISDGHDALHSEDIGLTDARIILRHLVGLEELSGGQYHSADVNNDGVISLSDVRMILKQMVGLEDINHADLVAEDGTRVTAITDDQASLQLYLNGDITDEFPSSSLVPDSAQVQPEVVALQWAENATSSLQLGVTFSQGSLVSYELTGPDKAWFDIDSQTGSVGFVAGLDFEAAADADGNNVYEFSVLSRRGSEEFARDIKLELVNVDESVIASPKVDGAAAYQLQQSSGSSKVDNLLIGSKWGTVPGQGVDITYSFYDSTSTFAYDTHDLGVAFGDDVKQVVRHFFEEIATYALINFTEITETSNQVGDVRIGYQAGTPYAAAWGPDYYSGDSYGGDVYFDLSYYQEWESAKPGDGFFSTIGHEIGHALGLEHPHGQGVYSDHLSFGTNAEVGQQPRDGNPYTIMSYAAYEGGNNGIHLPQHPSTYMIDDIAALQYLYGVNNRTNSTDTRYDGELLTAETPFELAIWDAGGVDWLDWSHLDSPALVDLTDGQLSFFGTRISNAMDADIAAMVAGEGILGIAEGAVIENAYGGLGTDAIVGNTSDNTLFGGLGFNVRDELWGGLGQDIFICALNEGANQLNNADCITDFTLSDDKIGLASGLSRADVKFSAGEGDYEGATILSTEQETLFILEGVSIGIADELQLVAVDITIT